MPDQSTKTGKCLGAESTQLQKGNKVAVALEVRLEQNQKRKGV